MRAYFEVLFSPVILVISLIIVILAITVVRHIDYPRWWFPVVDRFLLSCALFFTRECQSGRVETWSEVGRVKVGVVAHFVRLIDEVPSAEFDPFFTTTNQPLDRTGPVLQGFESQVKQRIQEWIQLDRAVTPLRPSLPSTNQIFGFKQKSFQKSKRIVWLRLMAGINRFPLSAASKLHFTGINSLYSGKQQNL